MPKRASSACIAYCGWFEAGGVTKPPCAILDAAIDFQAASSRSGVEPWQHHGAMRESCDHVQEFCGGRHRAGGASAITGPS
jgi:hypothetical protein